MIESKQDVFDVIQFLIGEMLTALSQELGQPEALLEIFIGALSLGSQQPEWAEGLLQKIEADKYRLDGMTRQEIARAIVELEPIVQRPLERAGSTASPRGQSLPEPAASMSRANRSHAEIAHRPGSRRNT
jgi:hypothetical protein